MVKVTKVAVWKIGDKYIEKADDAEKETRRIVALEMLEAEEWIPDVKNNIAEWVADNHEEVERRVKAAMAGT